MNRVCSIFAQMLGLIPRTSFHKAVLEHKAERHARGFSSWGQMVAMLYCHLAHSWQPAPQNADAKLLLREPLAGGTS
jgi:hypothetical protein